MLTIPTNSTVLANQAAVLIINQLNATTQRIIALRANGIAAVDAVEATTVNGIARPARPAVLAVSAEDLNDALGSVNCTKLDDIAQILA